MDDDYSETAYPVSVPPAAVSEFKKENCVGNQLMYKNMEVKTALSEHIFPNLKFNNDKTCNPCSDTCAFSVIESKLKAEQEMTPQHSLNTMLLTSFSSEE
jgi:hypothetical protein